MSTQIAPYKVTKVNMTFLITMYKMHVLRPDMRHVQATVLRKSKSRMSEVLSCDEGTETSLTETLQVCSVVVNKVN